MAVTEHQNGLISLAPPTDKKLEIQSKFSLILELIWLSLLVTPCILLAIFRAIFPPEKKSLKGQVVLVTGGGRGFGKGLALGFAKEGCKVAVVDINKGNAMETAAEIVRDGGIAKVFFTNVAKVKDVKELRAAVRKELGPVDILVNNAGLIHGDPLTDYSDEEIQGVIAVNLTSHFWMVREFLPEMRERNSGHIVAIASVASFVGGMSNVSAYVATKFGIRGFMEVVRAELEEKPDNKIKTTTVFPYFINTSAHYVEHWDLRLPPISIKEAVEATLNAVRSNAVTVTIPQYLYCATHVGRLLPQYIADMANRIIHVRVIPATKEEKETIPTTAIINELAKQEIC